MAKEFKVAYLGVKSYTDTSGKLTESYNDHLGIYVYRLPAEKILHIVENVTRRGINDEEYGIKPEFEYGEMMGGRFFPSVEKQELLEATQGVDILIVSGLVYFLYSVQFLIHLAEHDLSNTIVVLRMPLLADEALLNQDVPASRWVETLTGSSRSTRRWGRSKQKSKKKEKTLQPIVIGDLQHGGLDMNAGLKQLRSTLDKNELTTAIVTPIKETVTAGKSLLRVGQSFSNWLSKVVSS